MDIMTSWYMLILVCGLVPAAIVCGIIGWAIGKTKDAGGGGFMLGLFGPVGWLLILVAGDNRPRCLACGSVVHVGASVCRSCRADLNGRVKPFTHAVTLMAIAIAGVLAVAALGAGIGYAGLRAGWFGT